MSKGIRAPHGKAAVYLVFGASDLSGELLDGHILYVACGTVETSTEGIGVSDWTLDEIWLRQMDEQERVCWPMKYRSAFPLMW